MLSVLIPSYNHARYIDEAINSARRIDVPGKRIVVIDDASPDDSAAVIEANLRRHGAEGIEFIRKPVNRGAIDSVLTFLAMCETEYVYFMASDDIAVPEGIAELVNRLERQRTLQFMIGGGRNLLPDGSVSSLYGRRHERLFGLPADGMVKTLLLTDVSPMLCQSSVFRTSAIREVRGFERGQTADDFALFTRLLLRYRCRGVDFDFAPNVECVVYRHHGQNSYRNLSRQALSTLQVLEAASPPELRARTTAYRLAFYALVAAKRGDIASALKIAKMATLARSGWFVMGLFSNAFDHLRFR